MLAKGRLYFKQQRDTLLLFGALFLLIVALFRPTLPIKHNIYTYLLIADISQSMNAIDMRIDGNPVSRITYTKKLLREITNALPCDTKVSIGVFAGVSVAAMYEPIEICTNFSAIQDTIDHLDWRMGWSGNSRFRESLYSTAKIIRSFPEPAQVVYITDGEEAPTLHTFNTKDLSTFQGGDGWLFVGVGSEKGVAIPKLDSKNQLIGYWSNESFALQPGIAQISENTVGIRNDNVANSTHDRFTSKHNASYLKSVAKEINGIYIYGDSVRPILNAIKKQKPARYDVAPFPLDKVLASLAAIFILMTHRQSHPMQQIRQSYAHYRGLFQHWRLNKLNSKVRK